MELLFRDGVRAASRRDDGVQARADGEQALGAVQAPLVCVESQPGRRLTEPLEGSWES